MKKPSGRSILSLSLLILMWVAFLDPNQAWAQLDERFGVYVQDEASLLQPQTQLTMYQKAVQLHEKASGAQIGIVTVENLGNQTLEDLAVTRFRAMGLGDKSKNNGVLLLYAKQENHVRIEVGYGLEGVITDGTAGEILDQYFLPNLKAGQVDQAFEQTQLAIIQKITVAYGLDPAEISQTTLPEPPNSASSSGFFASIPWFIKVIVGFGIALLLFLDFKLTGGIVTFGLLSMLGRGRGSRGGGGSWGGRGGGGSSGGGGASR